MRCPFPGIDPFLEAQGLWPDFHAKFINYLQESLAENLPGQYEARIDERINLIQVPEESIRRIRPDVSITRRDDAPAFVPDATSVATMEPVTVPLVIEEESRETFIEIRERPGRTLVTVIELLSPSNKQEPGRSTYLAKRNALIFQPVHLVELDFLLLGRRLPLGSDYPPGQCFALISRFDRRPNCDVYHWPLRQALPTLPFPLKAPDPDVLLSLSEVFATTFERGRYAQSIDYSLAPPNVASVDDRDWIRQTITATQIG
jgi:hypothetical protein